MATDILLVGNHGPLMGWLTAKLEQEQDLRVVRVVARASEAVKVLARQFVDLVLADVDEVGAASAPAIEALRTARAGLHVILVSTTDEGGVLEGALKAKADGLLLKGELVETLIPGVRRVLRGGACFPRSAEARIEIGRFGAAPAERRSAKA